MTLAHSFVCTCTQITLLSLFSYGTLLAKSGTEQSPHPTSAAHMAYFLSTILLLETLSPPSVTGLTIYKW